MTDQQSTIQELAKKLWRIESEYNLVEGKIQGVHYWQLVRFNVFSQLTRQFGGYSQAHTSKNRFKDKVSALAGLMKYALTKNPLYGGGKVDFILFDHPRRVKVNGEYIDIYTHDFLEDKRDSSYIVMESPHLWKHRTTNVEKERRYTDHEILTTFIRKKMSPFRLSTDDKRCIAIFENTLKKEFPGFTMNLESLIESAIQNFVHKYAYYKRLYEKRKPATVYVVVSYDKFPMIAAAKDLGINVVEFQHGVITDYHFAYNHGSPNEYIPYFPDKILTFGEYWAKTKRFPKQTKVEVYGFPYLNRQLKAYKEVQKKTNQIVFISQGTIGKSLSAYANKLAHHLPGYNIIYKLHPGEYDRWKKEYPDLVEATGLPNVKVVDNNETNLHQILAESEYQVGVNSTAIFEGLALHCKTIIFDLPGIEYMNDLINNRFVKVARGIETFSEILKHDDFVKFGEEYFFYGSSLK